MQVYTFDKELRAETIRILLDAEACMEARNLADVSHNERRRIVR